MAQCEGCERDFDNEDTVGIGLHGSNYGDWCERCLDQRLTGPHVKGLADVPNLLRDTPPANLLSTEAVASVLMQLRGVQRWVRSLVQSYEAHFIVMAPEDGREISFEDESGRPVLSVRRGEFKGQWERDYEISYREV